MTEETETVSAKKSAATPEPEYDEYSVVTVLHGWGRVRTNERKWLDGIEFNGGVARHVPYLTAKRWQAIPQMGTHIYILPDDATDIDFARKTNIQPLSMPKMAAMLASMDLAKLVEELGPTKAAELIEQMRALVGDKAVKTQSGDWRSRTSTK